jgi:hypothetical protein
MLNYLGVKYVRKNKEIHCYLSWNIGALRCFYYPDKRNEMSDKAWGGRREGAGRPKSEATRKRRALCFFDDEWELIRQKAQEREMSPREYLYWLVEQDKT